MSFWDRPPPDAPMMIDCSCLMERVKPSNAFVVYGAAQEHILRFLNDSTETVEAEAAEEEKLCSFD